MLKANETLYKDSLHRVHEDDDDDEIDEIDEIDDDGL